MVEFVRLDRAGDSVLRGRVTFDPESLLFILSWAWTERVQLMCV